MNIFIATGKIVKKPEITKIGDFGALLKASYDIEIDNEENDKDIIPIISFGENAEFIKNNINVGQTIGIHGQIRFNKKSNNTLTIIAEKPEIINNIENENIKNNLNENNENKFITTPTTNNKSNRGRIFNKTNKPNGIADEEQKEKVRQKEIEKQKDLNAIQEAEKKETEQYSNNTKPINNKENINNENNNEIENNKTNEIENNKINNNEINNNENIEKETIEINSKFDEYFNKYNGTIYTINKDYNVDFSIKKYNLDSGNILINSDNNVRYIAKENDIYLYNKENRHIAIITPDILIKYFNYYNNANSFNEITETVAKNFYEELINDENKTFLLKLKNTLKINAYKIQIPENKIYTLKFENAENDYIVKNNDFIICINEEDKRNTNSQFALSENVFNQIFIK